MGGEIEITHGGYVAVDPDDLRAAASRVRSGSVQVTLARDDLLAMPAAIDGFGAASLQLSEATVRLSRAEADLDGLASAIGTMADVFELAELRARLAMLGAGEGDAAQARDLLQRVDRLLAGNALLRPTEARLRADWEGHVMEGFAEPWGLDADPQGWLRKYPALGALGWILGPATMQVLLRFTPALLRTGVEALAHAQGVLPAGLRLAPTPGDAVVVDTTGRVVDPRAGAALTAGGAAALGPGDVRVMRSDPAPGRVAGAPATLGEAVARVPSGRPQVRVEMYEFADGTRRAVAYVDGTRPDGGPAEPWDMDSNIALYADRQDSDALKAVTAALRDAGVDERTPVDLVGYSQGGMLANVVAASGEFTVSGVFTVGSPVEATLPEDVLSVAVRHTDDPVASLAGGGSPNGTGSADSLTITRTVERGHGADPDVPAHQLDRYRETVRLAEQSGDARMGAITQHFAGLREAARMTSTDYTAERIPG
ncbi:MAG: hypothetical protein JSS74_06365 [Actinobacteria bacterium]|nr:hypothetical protein [Actinomycetota bacterium]